MPPFSHLRQVCFEVEMIEGEFLCSPGSKVRPARESSLSFRAVVARGWSCGLFDPRHTDGVLIEAAEREEA